MSLTKTNLTRNVKMQYRYKLKSYVWVFSSLVVLQLVAVLFSLGGTGSYGTGSNNFNVSINYYSADMMIGFTMLWAFIISMQITSTVYRENEFMFVVNKSSTNLSDAAFLLTASCIGGITALMSGYLVKVIMYLTFNSTTVIESFEVFSVRFYAMGLIATILFIFLFSALGYVMGHLAQVNRLFIFLIPALLIASLFFAEKYGDGNFVFSIFSFYFQEANFLIFLVKQILTSALLFTGARIISNRLEVRT